MRALMLYGPNDLRLEQIADPAPGPGEVILRTELAMTCATDAKILRHGRHPALGALPAPFGHEVTGEVVACGAQVGDDLLGRSVVVANSAPCLRCRSCVRGRLSLCEDLTYLWGTYAEYVRVPARIVAHNLLSRPAGLAPQLAPLVEPLACAVNAVSRSDAAAGDRVVILGAGTQGQFLTACLAARGCEVIVCDPHEPRRARALRFGASQTHDAPRDAEQIAALRESLGGGGPEIVFEAVGRPETWEAAVSIAGRGGEVNLYGGCAPDTVVTLATGSLHYEALRIQGSYHHTPDTVRAALQLLLAGSAPFAELIGAPIGLEDVADTLAASGVKRPVVP